MKKILTWTVFVISTCIFTVIFYNIDPSIPFQAFFAACMVSGIISLIVPCIYQLKWRYDNGVDLFATLETDEKKLKEHMLFIMQHHGIEENLKELNDIFRNYPQWHLTDWKVFRAWYKAQIDHMIKKPEIYGLTMKGTGEPYSTDKDPLYDPDAPDWEEFDRPHYYDDDDDYDTRNSLKKSAEDGISLGIGFGIGSDISNN